MYDSRVCASDRDQGTQKINVFDVIKFQQHDTAKQALSLRNLCEFVSDAEFFRNLSNFVGYSSKVWSVSSLKMTTTLSYNDV